MSDYTITRTLDASFDRSIERVTEVLTDEGFGILSDIDVAAKLKEKLDVDMPAYRILGACNPPMAWKALQKEPHIGAMLPCNVILRAVDPGRTEVSAVDPVASMRAIENPDLESIATEVRTMLETVIERL